jgi:hypothetical protein
MAPVSIAIIPEAESTRALALLVEDPVAVDHESLATGTGSEDHPHLGAILVVDLEPGIGQRLLRCSDPEVDIALAPTCGLGVHPVGRFEAVHLAGRMLLVAGRVEPGDLPEA